MGKPAKQEQYQLKYLVQGFGPQTKINAQMTDRINLQSFLQVDHSGFFFFIFVFSIQLADK